MKQSAASKRTAQYRVRLSPAEKRALERAADERGITVADAFRLGAFRLLDLIR